MPFDIALITRIVPALAEGLYLTLLLSALAILLAAAWGIPVVLGLMFLAAGGMVGYFKKRGWW